MFPYSQSSLLSSGGRADRPAAGGPAALWEIPGCSGAVAQLAERHRGAGSKSEASIGRVPRGQGPDPRAKGTRGMREEGKYEEQFQCKVKQHNTQQHQWVALGHKWGFHSASALILNFTDLKQHYLCYSDVLSVLHPQTTSKSYLNDERMHTNTCTLGQWSVWLASKRPQLTVCQRDWHKNTHTHICAHMVELYCFQRHRLLPLFILHTFPVFVHIWGRSLSQRSITCVYLRDGESRHLQGGCVLKPSCQQRFKAGRVGLISKQEGINNERRRFLMCKQSDQRWQQPLLMFNSLDGKDIGQPALSDKLILLKKETFSDSLHSFHASDTLAQTCMLCWGIFSDFSHAALWQTWTD